MSHRAIAACAALLLLATTWAGMAQARNPNCAGGIQYVVQGMRDKDKGALEDYKREMLKAVDRLQQCAAEDPADFEALGYLGWAYAEIDSACAAGQAFQKAIAGLKEKDPKKVGLWESNRESYWAKNFNQGVADIQAAQAAYDPFTKEPADEAEKALKAEALGKYQHAIAALERAGCLKPGDPRTVRNLGTVYALMGELVKAESVLRAGLEAAPGDTDLVSALRTVRTNYAGQLLNDKQYDQAIAFYTDLLKASPDEADLHSGLADAYFKRAFGREAELTTLRNAMATAKAGAELQAAEKKVSDASERRNADYKLAGDEYVAAAKLRPTDADLVYNAALAYQNGSQLGAAEAQWRQFMTIKPDEPDALSAMGAVLAQQKKYDEAAATLHKAIMLKPKDKTLHRQLGGVYSGADNQPKSYEEMVVYLALERGTKADDAAAAAKKAAPASDAGKALAAMGAPEELYFWSAEGQSYETWFYWTKNLALTFRAGQQVAKSDWAAPPPRLTAPAARTTTGRKR